MAEQRAPAHHPSRTCTDAAPDFRTCFGSGTNSHATIERRTGATWGVITGPLRPLDLFTEWGPKVWISPDARTVLAEWLYACDGHLAVFVPAAGGKPRIVTGERDWRKAVASVPLGWTRDGRARVQVLRSWGPHHLRPAGVYLFDPKREPPKRVPFTRGC